MSKMSPSECFQMYSAVKRHFNSKTYDYIKYNGKIKTGQAGFKSRPDHWMFVKLSKTYDENDMLDLMISNFMNNPSIHVSYLFNEEAKETLLKYQKIKQSLTYQFKKDIEYLFSLVKYPDDLLKVKDGNPIILQELYVGNINLETFIILNSILVFFDMFDKKIGDDFVWPKYRDKSLKAFSFIQASKEYDKNKFENILKEKLKFI
jgi:hypothetical protein